jgi:hypothetical protein
VYLEPGGHDQKARLSRLGRHRMGKCCLYFRQLADLDEGVLADLVQASVADARRRHHDD